MFLILPPFYKSNVAWKAMRYSNFTLVKGVLGTRTALKSL